jgi:hypothetical protein
LMRTPVLAGAEGDPFHQEVLNLPPGSRGTTLDHFIGAEQPRAACNVE